MRCLRGFVDFLSLVGCTKEGLVADGTRDARQHPSLCCVQCKPVRSLTISSCDFNVSLTLMGSLQHMQYVIYLHMSEIFHQHRMSWCILQKKTYRENTGYKSCSPSRNESTEALHRIASCSECGALCTCATGAQETGHS